MSEPKTLLKVGAGSAPIKYPDEMFPTGGMENYTGVHDDPYIHVVLIEHDGVRYGIVNAEMVTIPDADGMKALAAKELDVDPANVIVANSHVLTAPHNFRRGKTEEEKKIEALMDKAHDEAFAAALAAAKATLRPAKFGYANGYTTFNVNRVVESDEGWIQGTCDEGDTDPSMPVFRFDDLEGNTIAIMYIVNCAAGMLEHTHSDDGGRLVSADIAGASAAFVRQEFPGCVAMYFAGATGDQWQAMRGMFGYMGRHGAYKEVDLGDKGWLLLELMGLRLGQQIVRAADSIECKDVEKISLTKKSISLPGRVMFRGGPGGVQKKPPQVRGDDVNIVVSVMTFDDVAWIGTTPEIMVSTIRHIKENSPFAQTAFSGWTNCGSDSTGTYMAEEIMYERETYQSSKSAFFRGAAEIMRDKVVEFVKEVKAEL